MSVSCITDIVGTDQTVILWGHAFTQRQMHFVMNSDIMQKHCKHTETLNSQTSGCLVIQEAKHCRQKQVLEMRLHSFIGKSLSSGKIYILSYLVFQFYYKHDNQMQQGI